MQRHFLKGMLTALVNNYATQLIAKPNVFFVVQTVFGLAAQMAHWALP
jgi:hypothetical protein